MRAISLKLPETLYGDLSALSEREGVTRSELVRRALTEFFQRETPPRRRSALAGLEGLVGSLEGPADLASNPSYLDDLGSHDEP